MRNVSRAIRPILVATLFLSTLVGLTVTLQPNVFADGGLIQVAPSGTDASDCGSGTACKTIKYAVEQRAQPDDTIQVAAGTYTETFQVNTPGLKIYGAGLGLSIIDGEDSRGPLVSFGPGLTSTIVFSGFTVQNGTVLTDGGGLYLDNSSPTIQAVAVQSNTAQTGGGIYLAGSSNPTIHGNTICGNTSAQLHNNTANLIDAAGNWWGTNTPQAGSAYTGSVTISPSLSVGLRLNGAEPTILPQGIAGELAVTMQAGAFNAPPGTQVRLEADAPVFPGATSTAVLTLTNGSAATTVQADAAGPVVISVFHACDSAQAIISKTVEILALPNKTHLPILMKNYNNSICPVTSMASYSLIPVSGAIDHPDHLHGDLNLAQRSYNLVNGVALNLVDFTGGTSGDPPQLPGLFANNRLPNFSAAYQVNSWDWGCGSDGCPGPPLSTWDTTLLGMTTTPNEPIFSPDRGANIYPGGFKAVVLYAEETRVTLGFTSQDSVASGYSVHLENVCVDPALLALYRSRIKSDGLRQTPNMLPGLKDNQALGTALGTEMRVSIRDVGTFLDPRSRKDWWQGK